MGDSPGANKSDAVLKAIAGLTPAPALVLHGGDVSEVGGRSQYDAFDAMARALGSIPLYAVPGNHDARWLDMGKAEFQRRYGPAHRSFTYGGVHFVLLDSTVDGQTWGHYARPELDWLAADLAALPPGTPVVAFAHHPILYPPLKFTDNDLELLDVLRPYNVVALFTGHGHLDLRWRVNGTAQFMTRAALDGGFRVVDVSGGHMIFYGALIDPAGGAPVLTKEADLPLTPAAPAGRLSVSDVKLQPGRLTLTARGENLTPGARAWGRIDQGSWQPLSQQPDGSWYGELAVPALPAGQHHLYAYATSEPVLPGQPASAEEWNAGDLGAGWYADSFFESHGAPTAPALQWQAPVGGPVRGRLAADDDRVYAGSGDGAVYALAAGTGARLWRTEAGAPVTAGVTLAGGRLLSASVGGDVLALDPVSGRVLWRQKTGAPVLARPAAAGDLVVAAGADGSVYGLDAATGAQRWRFRAGAAIGAAPALAAGAVYFGSWDGNAYALDAATGSLLWQRQLHSSVYYAPANASPIYFRGLVYFTAPTQNKTAVFALSAANGSTVWTSDIPAGYAAPLLFAGRLLVTTYGSWVHRLDPLTGAETEAPTGGNGEVYGPGVAPVGGWVAEGTMGGRLLFLDPLAPARIGEVALGDGWLLSRPLTHGGSAYIGTMAGSVAAVSVTAPPPRPLTWGDVGAPADAGAAGAPGFADTASHWSAPYVALLRALGIARGDQRGFRPDDPLTRAEWAALVARYLGLSTPSTAFRSQLVDVAGHWAAPYIQALEEKGLMVGELGPDGKRRFAPDRNLSRAEAAAVLVRLLGRSVPPGGVPSAFADIQGHWAAGAIGLLARAGLVTGEAAGGHKFFRPDRPVTRAEAAVFVVRLALGRDLR